MNTTYKVYISEDGNDDSEFNFRVKARAVQSFHRWASNPRRIVALFECVNHAGPDTRQTVIMRNFTPGEDGPSFRSLEKGGPAVDP